MKNKKALFAMFLICALLWSLCACGGAQEPQGDTVTFTDALAREVCVPKKPVRVAALLGSFADVWTLAGGTLCAAADDAATEFDLPLDGAVLLGGAHSPSLEALLGADPDFVLAAASTASHVQMEPTLTALGIPVAYFDVDSFDDYLSMLKICTALTDRPDLYTQNGAQLAHAITEIKQAYAGQQHPPEKRKILLLRVSSGLIKAKGSSGTVLGEMLCDMGCINIADSDATLLESLSIEAIIRQAPYRIFVVAMGQDTQAAQTAIETMMKENPAWATLDAVKAGRVHSMERALYHRKPNARWAQAYETLYNVLIGA